MENLTASQGREARSASGEEAEEGTTGKGRKKKKENTALLLGERVVPMSSKREGFNSKIPMTEGANCRDSKTARGEIALTGKLGYIFTLTERGGELSKRYEE